MPHPLPDTCRLSVPSAELLQAAAPSGCAEELASLAAPLLGAPLAVLYDAAEERVVVLTREGHRPMLDLPAEPLRALCSSVLGGNRPRGIGDVRRERFAIPVVDAEEAGFVAFAGVPLTSLDGEAIGVLAVLDLEARGWSPRELELLGALAPGVASALVHASLAVEHARVSAALGQTDSRHRLLLDTCPLPIYSLDVEGRFLEVNQAVVEVSGREESELIGQHVRELVAPEDLDAVLRALEGTMSGRDEPSQVEFRLLRPNGERRLVQVTRAAIEQDGVIVGVQGIGRDITEERTREAQFRRVERMASVAPLLSGVCHELNNPLTSIKSFAEFLLLDERGEEDREALEIVAREAERAARIVSDLRVVARQSQEAAASCAMVDLNEMVRQVVGACSATLTAASVELRLDLGHALPAAWAVRAQVEQVVAHLVTNAVQAMRDQPAARHITITTYPGDLGVVLQVADSGPGIRSEDQDRIFDPFWTTKPAGEGTGLGLSLVNSIVTDHGGRIRVDSSPGRGATFTLDFPAAAAAPVMTEAGTSSQVAARRSLRILIVDDEAPIRTSLTRYLERRGHQVREAAEGGAALDLLGVSTNVAPFDIIVADLRMPGLDGQRFVASLRERGDGLEDRVVFITGDAESPDVEDFLREAGAPVIWKPFELAEVAQIVEAHADMSAA